MVDNQKQWEDDEYIQEEQVEDESSENFEDDEYSDSDEYEDFEDEDDFTSKYDKKSGGSLVPLIIILVLVLGVGGFAAFKYVGNMQNPAPISTQQTQEQNDINASNMSTDEMANAFFSEAGGDMGNMQSVSFGANGETNVLQSTADGENAVATVSSAGETSNDLFGNNTSGSNGEQVVVSYDGNSRLNPFKPFETLVNQFDSTVKSEGIPSDTLVDVPFEIIEPPTETVEDKHITSLLETQISGILYDSVSPSAIVKINGQDQFVKVGDVVEGYKIEKITRNKVEISYMNNTYIASVGQLFTRGTLEGQASVDNLEKKFAGRYKTN